METEKKQSLGLRLNILLYRITRNWLIVVLFVLGTYATLPWVAPTLMKLGLTAPANVLYTLYSPMCHQLAFRSVFLFGEQTFYPREIVGTDLRPYEAYAATTEGLSAGASPEDFSVSFWLPARSFQGNEQMGYKTAMCARDVAIYLAMTIGGLIYAIPTVRRKLRPIPWWLYILVGLGPIGLDGFSQLLSYPPFALWEVRETAPFFRVATGALFGLMNAWLAFPYLEMSFTDTRRQIERKFAESGISLPR